MKISVFGLGYVGTVTAACLAEEGHQVIGVDINPDKVKSFNSGISTVLEPGIALILRRNVQKGRLCATDSAQTAVNNSDMAIVCVGTPSSDNGALDLQHVKDVSVQIGEALRGRATSILIVLRSTILPGSTETEVIPILEQRSGRCLGDGFHILYHPEFLREGSALQDFYNPPSIIIGECEEGTGSQLRDIYTGKFNPDSPRIICSITVAEMVKYCSNLFHALKITFANEVGSFCNTLGIDSGEVMEIFCRDNQLNISASYLRPGFAFGGSCLPKDVRAFTHAANQLDLNSHMLAAILPSNQHQIIRAVEAISAMGAKEIGFYGLAFKAGTDDLRESPYVKLAARLIANEKNLTIYDRYVNTAELVGQNKLAIQTVIPNLARLLTNTVLDLGKCDLIVVCHSPELAHERLWAESRVKVLDITSGGMTDSSIGAIRLT